MEPRNRFHFTLLLLLHMSCFASRSSCALTIKLSYPKAFEIEAQGVSMPIISEENERAGRRIVSGQEATSGSPEVTYEDYADEKTNNRISEGRVVHNGQEMTLEEMGRQPLPEAVQEHYAQYLRSHAEEARGDSVEVNPGTPDSTEERTMGPALRRKVRPTSRTSRMPRSECRQSFTKLTRNSETQVFCDQTKCVVARKRGVCVCVCATVPVDPIWPLDNPRNWGWKGGYCMEALIRTME